MKPNSLRVQCLDGAFTMRDEASIAADGIREGKAYVPAPLAKVISAQPTNAEVAALMDLLWNGPSTV